VLRPGVHPAGQGDAIDHGLTIDLSAMGVRVVLLDVEGTTTPISFVTDVLFPYARRHLRAFLRERGAEPAIRSAVEALLTERRLELGNDGQSPNDDESVLAYAELLMDRDSKSPGLKALQGFIWEEGFDDGRLQGVVFDDVPAALRRWRAAGVRTAIYSSGSVLAQRRLFGSTAHGDLTPDLDAHFDTAVGAKRDPMSYARIAEHLGEQPPAILFLSDVAAELIAARAAGCQVGMTVRPGNSPQPDVDGSSIVRSFDEVGVAAGGAAT
jgi:2,3-diketo-5-methylthio-1-phosphopentane phosphatase